MRCESNAIITALHSGTRVRGLTHNFYHYPARFSPEFARAVIEEFSSVDDCVVDPFMGGGTTIVEAVALGRKSMGIDINPIAHFLARVKTTPLSDRDVSTLRGWANRLNLETGRTSSLPRLDARLQNVPGALIEPFIRAVSSLDDLEFPRQKQFARCALLGLGQWAVDCRLILPTPVQMRERLLAFVEQMIEGADQLVAAARAQGIAKNRITDRRTLYLGAAHTTLRRLVSTGRWGRPRLVLTSPPYPGVHVLYHRWQVASRRETPLPFWLVNCEDGQGASHYTLGGRSVSGLVDYYEQLTEAFRALRQLIDPEAFVVQLIAFSDPERHLPDFLGAMSSAGYEEVQPFHDMNRDRPSRRVPHRKWYASSERNRHTSQETLLVHRVCK